MDEIVSKESGLSLFLSLSFSVPPKLGMPLPLKVKGHCSDFFPLLPLLAPNDWPFHKIHTRGTGDFVHCTGKIALLPPSSFLGHETLDLTGWHTERKAKGIALPLFNIIGGLRTQSQGTSVAVHARDKSHIHCLPFPREKEKQRSAAGPSRKREV